MKQLRLFTTLVVALVAFVLAACHQEDPGPLQAGTRSFDVVDFDRIEASDAIDVTVMEGSSFSIDTHGDRRDLDDLQVFKSGSTLIIKFGSSHNRQYTTFVTISMPVLGGLKFSGAVKGRASGFTATVDRFDLSLSGASEALIQVKANGIFATLSGASFAQCIGSGKVIEANVSGASTLTSFDYPVEQAKIVVSGASYAKVTASQLLKVNASGASEVRYRGQPQLSADVSGASRVVSD